MFTKVFSVLLCAVQNIGTLRALLPFRWCASSKVLGFTENCVYCCITEAAAGYLFLMA
jgi:hypothetical protein